MSTIFSFFAVLHHKNAEWKTYVFKAMFVSLHIQNREDPHKISFSEPGGGGGGGGGGALSIIKFPTCVII